MRALVGLVLLLGGCRQILNFDEPVATPGDSASGDAADALVAGPRKKQITIDGSRIAGSLANFPVWVTLDDPEIAVRATDDGRDIHFTQANGTELVFELQRWSRSAKRLEAWVRLDLAQATDTVFEVHYGDADTTPRSDPAGTFSNGYAAVWHFEDTTATIVDATGSQNGTATGFTASSQVPAKLGGGIDFDGATTRIDFSNPLKNNDPHTISAWVDQRTAVDYDSILTVGLPETNRSRWFHSSYSIGDGIAVGFYGNDFDTVNTNIENVGATLLHWVFEGSNRVSRVYKDGVEVGTKTHNNQANTTGTDGYIGFAPADWGVNLTQTCHLNGVLDEVRIATVARSAAYIATEFANQSSPSTFFSIGPELVP